MMRSRTKRSCPHLWIAALLSAFACFASHMQAHAPHDVVDLVVVSPDFASDQTVFAHFLLTNHKVLARSQDGGRSWTEYASPVVGQGIRALAVSPAYDQDGIVFAATLNGGIWRSTDRGLTWVKKSDGIDTEITYDVALSPDFASDQTLLAATEYGLFRSADQGESWEKMTTGLLDIRIGVVGFAPDVANRVYCGGNTMHLSLDKGMTWTGLHTFADQLKVLALSPDFGSDLSMAVAFRIAQGIMSSTDAGVTWTPCNDGLTDLAVNDIAIAEDGVVFAVTSDEACFRAESLNATWSLFTEGFEPRSNQTDIHYRAVAPSPAFGSDQTVFVASFEGFFKSVNRGEYWTQSDIYHQKICRSVNPSPAYTDDGLCYVANYGGGPMVFRHTKSAGSSSVFRPLTQAGGFPGTPVGEMGVAPHGITPLEGVKPNPWTALANEITSLHSSTLRLSPQFETDRTLFYGYMGLWKSVNGGASWEKMPIPIMIPRGIAFSPAFETDCTVYMGSGRVGTFVSLDAGMTWTELTGGLPPNIRTTHIVLSPGFETDRTLFISTTEHGVWRSYDAGASWKRLTNGLTADNVRAFALSSDFVDDRQLLAGSVGEGLFRSADAGDTWTAVNSGFPSGSQNVIESIAYSPDYENDGTVFVVSFYDHVLRSEDQGWTWQSCKSGLPPDAPRVIAVSPDFASDDTVFLSSHNWMWWSRNRGETWTAMPGYNRVDDEYPSIRFEGDWIRDSSTGSFALQLTKCKDQGAYRELEFHGDSVEWIALKSPDSGIAEIRIDGEFVTEVDCYTPQTEYQVIVFEKPFTKKEWHTLRITVTGTKNPRSADTWIRPDGFAYTF